MRASIPILLLFATTAYSQGSVNHTDVAPYTDYPYPNTMTWKLSMTREQVKEELALAQREGTIPSGESPEYPKMKFNSTGAVIKAPPATIDGYRFVGGEAGYVKP